MAKGLENIFHMGDKIFVPLSMEASDSVRSEAILSGTTPEEIVRRALTLYVEHEKLAREGWDGPVYSRELPAKGNTVAKRLGAFLGLSESVETVKLNVNFDATPPETEA